MVAMFRTAGLIGLVPLAGCELLFARPDSTVTPTDATADGEVPSSLCLTRTPALRDDFPPAAAVGPEWLALDTTNMGAISVDGTLRFDVAAIGTVAVARNAFYDLAESELSVEVQPTNYDVESFIQLGAAAVGSDRYGSTGNVLVWRLADDTLQPGYLEDNSFNSVGGGLPYDPDVHRVWSVSRMGDTVVWSYWDGLPANPPVPVATNANLPWARTVRPVLIAFKNASGADFTVAWDKLDGGGIPEAACPADQLIEDFTDGAYDPFAWHVAQVRACQWTTDPQGLHATLSNPDALCRIESATLYNLVDHAIVVEIDPADLDTHIGRIELMFEDNRVADVSIESGMLFGAFDGGNVGSLPVQRYVRFRGTIDPITSQGKVFWEASANAIDYVPLGEFGGIDGVDRVQLRLSLTGRLGGTAPAEMRFLGVNVPLP